MKKLIIPFFIGILTVSCSKKETVSSSSEADSIVQKQETPEEKAVAATGLQEVTPDQLSALLKTKNDTLYVTNFFATWCPPCIREIPHFTEKIEELKGKPVKFTFIDLDNKTDWDTTVNVFVDEHKMREYTLLVDGSTMQPTFFKDNFKTWTGETIPFTYFRKGDKTKEVNGSITKEELERILSELK